MTQSPRDRAAAARGQQQRAEQRRRAIVIISAVVVLAIVGAVIAVIAVNKPSHTTPIANNRVSTSAGVMQQVSSVPVSTLDRVGVGTLVAAPRPYVDPHYQAPGGKPQLLYIGAEFCPYCAGERWAMAVALSRFGTLSNVKTTQSASNDVYPNTATLDFVDTTYASNYLTFVPIEHEDRDHKKLKPVTAAQNALWAGYAKAAKTTQGYPFLDFGNKYAFEGPTFVPQPLAHLTQAQIAAKLADPNDPVAKGIDGSANLITAAICGMTHDQPATVCKDQTISRIEGQINKLQSAGG